MQPRHELKQAVNYADYLAVKSRLSQVMRYDTHAGGDGVYHIRSIYFDDYHDTALSEKLMGVSRREKFRIRYYNFDDSFIRLEKKAKHNRLYYKSAATLSRAQCDRLFAGDCAFLRDSGQPLCMEFYAKLTAVPLRPKTIVDYRREALYYPPGNVRVTFDRDVCSGLFATRVFDRDLLLTPTHDERMIIMEVKYDNFLPRVIADCIQSGDRMTQAISKYVLARSFE